VSITIHKRHLPFEALPEGRCSERMQRQLLNMWEQDPMRRPSADEAAKGLMLVLEVRGCMGVGPCGGG
jgi:hypothetical protein